MLKKYQIVERTISLIGVFCFFACISIVSYWVYYEYFYVNTQPIRIYPKGEVTKILDYYNHDESKVNVLKKNTFYTLYVKKAFSHLIICLNPRQ